MSSVQLQFSLFIDQLHVCGHKRRFEEHIWLLHLLFFTSYMFFCQAPISTMGFGTLLTSMPGGIALPWRWITMLPPPAMPPLSPGSTLGTATILEVGCFREVFVMQIPRCSPLSSPQVHCLQLGAKVRADFRQPIELQCFQHCGQLKGVGQGWQRENKQNCKHSCKSGLLIMVANGYLHLSDNIYKIYKAVLTMSGFGFAFFPD